MQSWLTDTRQHLHQWPELMYQEYNTSAYIRKQLDRLGIQYMCAQWPMQPILQQQNL